MRQFLCALLSVKPNAKLQRNIYFSFWKSQEKLTALPLCKGVTVIRKMPAQRFFWCGNNITFKFFTAYSVRSHSSLTPLNVPQPVQCFHYLQHVF